MSVLHLQAGSGNLSLVLGEGFVLATFLLLWRDTVTKASDKRAFNGTLAITEGQSLWLSWQGAWQQVGRHGTGTVS